MSNTAKIKPVSKFSADEAEMVRIAVHTQLRVLRRSLRVANERTAVDPGEVAFYRERIAQWEPFVEKVEKPYDDAARANTSQDGESIFEDESDDDGRF